MDDNNNNNKRIALVYNNALKAFNNAKTYDVLNALTDLDISNEEVLDAYAESMRIIDIFISTYRHRSSTIDNITSACKYGSIPFSSQLKDTLLAVRDRKIHYRKNVENYTTELLSMIDDTEKAINDLNKIVDDLNIKEDYI